MLRTILRHIAIPVMLSIGGILLAQSSHFAPSSGSLPQLASWQNVNAYTYRLNHSQAVRPASSAPSRNTSSASAPSAFKLWTSTSHSLKDNNSGGVVLLTGNTNFYVSGAHSSQGGAASSSYGALSYARTSIAPVGSARPQSVAQITVSIATTTPDDLYPHYGDEGEDINALHIGELLPIGDGLWVLLLLAFVHALYRGIDGYCERKPFNKLK